MEQNSSERLKLALALAPTLAIVLGGVHELGFFYVIGVKWFGIVDVADILKSTVFLLTLIIGFSIGILDFRPAIDSRVYGFTGRNRKGDYFFGRVGKFFLETLPFSLAILSLLFVPPYAFGVCIIIMVIIIFIKFMDYVYLHEELLEGSAYFIRMVACALAIVLLVWATSYSNSWMNVARGSELEYFCRKEECRKGQILRNYQNYVVFQPSKTDVIFIFDKKDGPDFRIIIDQDRFDPFFNITGLNYNTKLSGKGAQ